MPAAGNQSALASAAGPLAPPPRLALFRTTPRPPPTHPPARVVQTAPPAPAAPPAPPGRAKNLAKCLSDAGITFVDKSNPKGLAQAAKVRVGGRVGGCHPSGMWVAAAVAGLHLLAPPPAALPTHPRQVWNKLNTTVPAAVAYPGSDEEVSAAVLCAAEAGIKPVAR